MSTLKRVAIFAHYDKHNLVDDYVLYYLCGLREVAQKVVFVSPCNLSEEEKAKVAKVADHIIIRENKGYDFGSWKDGISVLGYNEIAKYDELILCNDSCYAPLVSFKDTFARMQEEECDCWSLTECYIVQKHMQSYFMVFRKSAFLNEVFHNFFNSVCEQKTKMDYIINYEVGISKLMTQTDLKVTAAFKIGIMSLIKCRFVSIKRAFCRFCEWCSNIVKHGPVKGTKASIDSLTTNSFGKVTLWFKVKSFFTPFLANPSITNCLELIKEKQIPTLKVMALNPPYEVKDSLPRNINSWRSIIEKHCPTYNVSLIENHLHRIK